MVYLYIITGKFLQVKQNTLINNKETGSDEKKNLYLVLK